MKKIFLSHSSKDKIIIRRLESDLRTNGFDTWLDEKDITAGDDLIDEISSGVQESDFLVIALSNNSVNSPWVEKEWKIKMITEMKSKTVSVIPLKLDNCTFPDFLALKNYADFSTDYNIGLSQLLKSLKKKHKEEEKGL